MDNLPKGIWYEAQRQRYRVRIYRKDVVQHLSYHETLEEAIEALQQCNAIHTPNKDRLTSYIEKTRLYFQTNKEAYAS